MKPIFTPFVLILFALIITFATLAHGFFLEISLFHGMILHPVFLTAAMALFALAKALSPKRGGQIKRT